MLSIIATYSNMDGLKSTPQYGFNKGLSMFKDKGCKASVSKFSDNVIGMNTVDLIDMKQLTKDICISALSYLMFLKRKKTVTVKARGCVNIQPQRKYVSKKESSYPTMLTVLTYALFIFCAMEAIESFKVIIYDIPGVFMQADWPEDNECYLNFERIMVKMICEINPSYKKYVLISMVTGKKKLYKKLTEAVYRTLFGAILF